MKTNTTHTFRNAFNSAVLVKAILPILMLFVSVSAHAQCARTSTPPVNFGCNSGDPIDTFTLNNIASPVSPGCSSGSYLYSSLRGVWLVL